MGQPTWTMSYDLVCTALIMLDVVDLGPLQLYKKLITGYHRRYGPSVWHIVYQANRWRAAVANKERAKKEGQVTDFKPDRLWNTGLDSIKDLTWWKYEPEQPALLHLNRRAADRDSSLQSEGPPNKKRLTRDTEHHETTGGRYTHSMKGKPLCPDYNSGRCSNTVWGIRCGDRPEHVHM